MTKVLIEIAEITDNIGIYMLHNFYFEVFHPENYQTRVETIFRLKKKTRSFERKLMKT